ncbi:hypothetical protein [Polyangium spumosum]|uniref:Uncharacterized protein n=1 Tax=Polyangium spumosum TaxID=889282 RepID=A0A6N7PNE4_9BACT|nr:hypothetical protein [Polyangium spumosum]MRG93538.1 hypothetical protein [Polyangium spumosum]
MDGFTCTTVLVRIRGTQFHLGLGRNDEPHEPVLHLAWHRDVRDEPLEGIITRGEVKLPAAVIKLSLDPLIDETLQVLARRVARRYANTGLAYGFGEATATFDQGTGALTDDDAAFTCATFVLAMLRSVGVQMIDVSRWREPTEEDLRWQRDIGDVLVQWIQRSIHGADLTRAEERVEQDLGARRYRPTDVAAASLFGPGTWPVGAEDVEPQASMLASKLPWPGA